MSQSQCDIHPLRPAIHRRLGALLPHQLANGPQAHPQAEQLLLLSMGFTPKDLMRYYPMFPWAIPHPRVDHLRVTHPFATLMLGRSPALPFDLHA